MMYLDIPEPLPLETTTLDDLSDIIIITTGRIDDE